MKKPSHHLIAEAPRKRGQVELTIGVDLGDVWSHYCTLNQDGEVIDRGRFRTTAKAVEKWFAPVPHARVAMEAGVHSIWISEQLEQLGHEVIVANVRELRAISHSDRKSDDVDAEKLARYARLDPEILRPISHRTVEQQEALTLIRARELLIRLRTAAINAVRGLTKACGHRMPASSTKCFAQRGHAAMPPGLELAPGPILAQIAEMTLKIKQYDRDIQRLTQTEEFPKAGIRDAVIDPTDGTPRVPRSFDANFKEGPITVDMTGWTSLSLDDFLRWSNCITNFCLITPDSTRHIVTSRDSKWQTGLGHGEMVGDQLVHHVHDRSDHHYRALLASDSSKSRTVIILTNQKHGNIYAMDDAINAILDDKPYLPLSNAKP